MNDLGATLDMAYEMFEKKEFEAALEKLSFAEGFLTGDENLDVTVILQNFKGFNYLGINDTQNAKLCFEKALRANPSSSQACAGLGEVYFLSNMDNEAKTMFEWAIYNKPGNKFAIAGLARVNRSIGLPDDHYTLEVQVPESKMSDFTNSLTHAYELFAEKRFNESLQKINEAESMMDNADTNIKAAADISTLENFKGFNYLAMQKLAEAGECFERALKLNPASSQACAGLGELFYLTEKDREAKTMYEWAVRNNRTNAFAVNGLAKVNSMMGYPQNHSALC